MYRKFRNVPIFKDIPPICSYMYFLGFRVGKYALVLILDSHGFILYFHSRCFYKYHRMKYGSNRKFPLLNILLLFTPLIAIEVR